MARILKSDLLLQLEALRVEFVQVRERAYEYHRELKRIQHPELLTPEGDLCNCSFCEPDFGSRGVSLGMDAHHWDGEGWWFLSTETLRKLRAGEPLRERGAA